MNVTDDQAPADDATGADVPAPRPATAHIVNASPGSLLPAPMPPQDRSRSGEQHPAHRSD